MNRTPTPPPAEACEDTGSLPSSLPLTPPASNRASDSHPSSSSVRCSSDHSSPPELAAEVRKILAYLKDRSTSNTARLTVEEFKQLESEIRKDETIAGYYFDQARVNWFPPRDGELKGELEIKMTSPLHETFNVLFQSTIMNWYTSVAEGEDSVAKGAAMKLLPGGASSTPSVTGGKMSPDAQFNYGGLPTLVIEVGYSQSTKSLKRKAASWFRCSGPTPTTVITFDLPYQTPEERQEGVSSNQNVATYTVYRSEPSVGGFHIDKVCDNFCDDAGNVVENEVGGALALSLNDFLPHGDRVDDASNISISIRHGDLAQMFVKGLTAQKAIDEYSMSTPSEEKEISGLSPSPTPSSPPTLPSSESDKAVVRDLAYVGAKKKKKRQRDSNDLSSPSEAAANKRQTRGATAKSLESSEG